MYLLEYRNDSLPLHYSQEPFSIPSNVTVLATMNSADRSLALVDYALRRRFQFVEFGYQADVLRGHYHATSSSELGDCLKFIDLVNAKIGDPRLQIGHSYFLFKDSRVLSKQTLREVWNAQIYPLLQEYFLSSVSRLEEFSFDGLWSESTDGAAPGEAA
jgi:5-methylcytosine-specific restriction endonuclease McrBC GTP-binding regulatory subunit McrB